MVVMPVSVAMTAIFVVLAPTVVIMGIIGHNAGAEACDQSGSKHKEESFRSHFI
ncbi:MAG TPA: hypothetical protein VK956_01130 [Verrucomicrobium sp.]|nr:hypothetical protein [Verrucomicrobium sp.]